MIPHWNFGVTFSNRADLSDGAITSASRYVSAYRRGMLQFTNFLQCEGAHLCKCELHSLYHQYGVHKHRNFENALESSHEQQKIPGGSQA